MPDQEYKEISSGTPDSSPRYVRVRCIIEGPRYGPTKNSGTGKAGKKALIDVPVMSVVVTSGTDNPATCSVRIPATNKAIDIEPRSLIYVFYTESTQSIPSDHDWKVMFIGEYLSSQIIHSRNTRMMDLNCADCYSFLASIYLYQKSWAQWTEEFLMDYSIIEGGVDTKALKALGPRLEATYTSKTDLDAGVAGPIALANTTGTLYLDSAAIADFSSADADIKDKAGGTAPPIKVIWSGQRPGTSVPWVSKTIADWPYANDFKTALDSFLTLTYEAGARFSVIPGSLHFFTEGAAVYPYISSRGEEDRVVDSVIDHIGKSRNQYEYLYPAFVQDLAAMSGILGTQYNYRITVEANHPNKPGAQRECIWLHNHPGAKTSGFSEKDSVIANNTNDYIGQINSRIEEHAALRGSRVTMDQLRIFFSDVEVNFGFAVEHIDNTASFTGQDIVTGDPIDISHAKFSGPWGLSAVITVYAKDDLTIDETYAQLSAKMRAFSESSVHPVNVVEISSSRRYLDNNIQGKSNYVRVDYYIERSDWKTLIGQDTAEEAFREYVDQLLKYAGTKDGSGPWIQSLTTGTPSGVGDTLLGRLREAFTSGKDPSGKSNLMYVVDYFMRDIIKQNNVNPYIRYQLYKDRVLHQIGGVNEDPFAAKLFITDYVTSIVLGNTPQILGGITTIGEVFTYAFGKIYYHYVSCPVAYTGAVRRSSGPSVSEEKHIKTMLFMPKLFFYDAPTCNYLGPGEYYEFSWNKQPLTEITRLGAVLTSQIAFWGNSNQPFPKLAVGKTIIAPTKQFGDPPDRSRLEHLAEHEEKVGILPDWMKFTDFMATIAGSSLIDSFTDPSWSSSSSNVTVTPTEGEDITIPGSSTIISMSANKWNSELEASGRTTSFAGLYPPFRDMVVQLFIDAAKLDPPLILGKHYKIRGTGRSLVRQARSTAAGLSSITKPWTGAHPRALAVDIDPMPGYSPANTINIIGREAYKRGLVWGGKYKKPDKPHIAWPRFSSDGSNNKSLVPAPKSWAPLTSSSDYLHLETPTVKDPQETNDVGEGVGVRGLSGLESKDPSKETTIIKIADGTALSVEASTNSITIQKADITFTGKAITIFSRDKIDINGKTYTIKTVVGAPGAGNLVARSGIPGAGGSTGVVAGNMPGYYTEFYTYVNRWATFFNVQPALMWGVIRKETGYLYGDGVRTGDDHRNKVNEMKTIVSPAGAQGLMQFIPSTGKSYWDKLRKLGIAPDIPWTNTLRTNPDYICMLGAAYLAELLNRYRNIYAALAEYNGGPSQSRRVMQGQAPSFSETRGYVSDTNGVPYYYRLYLGGNQAVDSTSDASSIDTKDPIVLTTTESIASDSSNRPFNILREIKPGNLVPGGSGSGMSADSGIMASLINTYAKNYIDYEYLVRRFAYRNGNINMPFNPEVVAGFPAVIQARYSSVVESGDPDRYRTLFGYVTNVQHVIDVENGQASTFVSLTMLRTKQEDTVLKDTYLKDDYIRPIGMEETYKNLGFIQDGKIDWRVREKAITRRYERNHATLSDVKEVFMSTYKGLEFLPVYFPGDLTASQVSSAVSAASELSASDSTKARLGMTSTTEAMLDSALRIDVSTINSARREAAKAYVEELEDTDSFVIIKE
jgi:hypothetical protein